MAGNLDLLCGFDLRQALSFPALLTRLGEEGFFATFGGVVVRKEAREPGWPNPTGLRHFVPRPTRGGGQGDFSRCQL
jgi:hypothetical protein